MRSRVSKVWRTGEQGAALIVALEVLVVVMLIVAALATASVSFRSTTERDAESKQAFAAANAGLAVARYRINRLQPEGAKCVTDRQVAPGTGGAAPGECPGFTGTLGNGAGYTYYVTPVVAAPGVNCAGVEATPDTDDWGDRCITSVGTANGVSRRVQALVRAANPLIPIFPLPGITALNGIDINQNGFGDINGPVGSNGLFKLKSCKTGSGPTVWDPGPGAPPHQVSCTPPPTIASPPRTTPYSLLPVDPIYAGTETTNDNGILAAAGFNYNAGSRELTDNGTVLTVDGPNPRAGSDGIWVINVCKAAFTKGGTQFKLLNGAVLKFLIDDVSRPGSGCSGSGTLDITNTSCFNMTVCAVAPSPSTPGDPAALQMYQYGSQRIDVTNKAGFSGTFYAPNAEIKFTNKSTWYGALAALEVNATNGIDFYSADVSGVGISGGDTAYTRTQPGFIECRSAPATPSDPESGC